MKVPHSSLAASAARGFAALVLVTASSLATAADLTVFAAASLKESLDRQIQVFQSKTGHLVRASYAGSNALAKQIENGAPADLFLSADEEWMDYLAARKLVVAPTRRDLLTNELVLIAPTQTTAKVELTPTATAASLAAALGQGRLAVANPDNVPAGKYARTALTALGAWAAVESKLARSDNVRAALAFVARGEAPLGIVYRTDAIAEPRVRIVAVFPADTHAPIVYPGAIVTGRDSEAARDLLNHLSGEEGAAVWRQFGFVPKR